MTECRSGCGHCCNPVIVPFTQFEVAQMLPNNADEAEDRRFVLEDLTPISLEQGRAMTPFLHGRTMTNTAGESIAEPVYYACKHFDVTTRECTNYENRPPLCRAYPQYGRAVVAPNTALPWECSFNEDIPVELRTKPPAGWKPDVLPDSC